MTIYIDIGNTNIKINFNDKYISFLSNGDYTVDSFYDALPDELKTNDIKNVFLCSVVPSKETLIKGLSKKYWGVAPKLIAYPIKTGITINTETPKEIGSDLVCLAAFASANSEKAIIVNMGTATTLTYVVKNSIEGVVIIPGFTITLNSLIKKAAKIGEISLHKPKRNYGKNTTEAISIGMLSGHEHMIRGLVNDIDPEAKVFLSGGNSKILAKQLNEYELIKEATIEGIKVIEKLN